MLGSEWHEHMHAEQTAQRALVLRSDWHEQMVQRGLVLSTDESRPHSNKLRHKVKQNMYVCAYIQTYICVYI